MTAHMVRQLGADVQLGVQAGRRVLKHHRHPGTTDGVEPACAHPHQFGVAETYRTTHGGGCRKEAQRSHGTDALAGTGLSRQTLDLPGGQIQRDALHYRSGVLLTEGDCQFTDPQCTSVRCACLGSARVRRARSAHGPSFTAGDLCCSLAPARSAEDNGSRASRRESPMKLNAITTLRIARPGKTPSHHASIWLIAPEIIDPHSAVGGWAPKPRKDSPVSRRIAVPMSSE